MYYESNNTLDKPKGEISLILLSKMEKHGEKEFLLFVEDRTYNLKTDTLQ